MIPWHVSHLLGSTICQNLRKDLQDPVGACLSLSYTSDKQFSKLCHLAIFWSPWPVTLAPTNEAIRHETTGKKTLSVKGKKLLT